MLGYTEDLSDIVVTAFEHAQAMGFNLLDDSWQKSKLLNLFSSLEPSQLKLLMGNGMHIKVEAAWMFFVLLNIARVEPERVHRCVPISHELLDSDSDVG